MLELKELSQGGAFDPGLGSVGCVCFGAWCSCQWWPSYFCGLWRSHLWGTMSSLLPSTPQQNVTVAFLGAEIGRVMEIIWDKKTGGQREGTIKENEDWWRGRSDASREGMCMGPLRLSQVIKACSCGSANFTFSDSWEGPRQSSWVFQAGPWGFPNLPCSVRKDGLLSANSAF